MFSFSSLSRFARTLRSSFMIRVTRRTLIGRNPSALKMYW